MSDCDVSKMEDMMSQPDNRLVDAITVVLDKYIKMEDNGFDGEKLVCSTYISNLAVKLSLITIE
jgi:hypothetical protein